MTKAAFQNLAPTVITESIFQVKTSPSDRPRSTIVDELLNGFSNFLAIYVNLSQDKGLWENSQVSFAYAPTQCFERAQGPFSKDVPFTRRELSARRPPKIGSLNLAG
jgi:hypothetical protein